MYSPQLGRFISRDPLDSATDPYEYVGGRPIDAVDPLGLQEIPLRRLPPVELELLPLVRDALPPALRRIPPPLDQVNLDTEFRVDEKRDVTSAAVPGVAAPHLLPGQEAFEIGLPPITVRVEPDEVRKWGVGAGTHMPEGVVGPYDPTKVNVIGGGQEAFVGFVKDKVRGYVKEQAKPIQEEVKEWARGKIGGDLIRGKGECAPPRGKGRTYKIRSIQISPDLRSIIIEGGLNIRFGAEITW